MKDDFQYSRTILHFPSTNTFSPVLCVSTKTDNNNCVVSFVKTVENFILWVILPWENVFIYITYNQEPGQWAVIIRNTSVHICLNGTVFHGVSTQTI